MNSQILLNYHRRKPDFWLYLVNNWFYETSKKSAQFKLNNWHLPTRNRIQL